MHRNKPVTSITLDKNVLEAVKALTKRKNSTISRVINQICVENDEIKKIIINEDNMSLTNNHIAKLCHQVWKAHREVNGHSKVDDWDNLPDKDKSTAIWGVELVKNNPDLTPKELFLKWKARKIEINDENHPYMVGEFSELPEEEQKTMNCL
ncbi:MAG: hypothetical protein OMM_14083 [Candidatus Magnetoglobus multicellularis str. Araruama]|uniref:Uncharacterized protein n=1 Tax=Candidatus Magnetoglobus multicellularis str. Araruama TaxID=890399 RepID=A0A1V1NSL1_9BACT|nr:MAG: hypothetical protein OMM_14083 [Candidatus Magnetoglobus multicellularis str. Araruama]